VSVSVCGGEGPSQTLRLFPPSGEPLRKSKCWSLDLAPDDGNRFCFRNGANRVTMLENGQNESCVD
jgi:hypothetical protein